MKRSLVIMIVALCAGVVSCAAAYTPAIDAPNSVASLEEVELGGLEQWILVRGNDVDKPVLLFLHGGPGSTQMPYAHFYGYPLEEHFIVVHWDQRGAGKSWNASITPSALTIDRYVEDAHELTLLLCERFDKDKIYVIGKSWGTLLGLKLVQEYPELFYAYVGMGQVVDLEQNEAISYQFVLEEAERRNNVWALIGLKTIGPPPYRLTSDAALQRYWLGKFGGVIWNPAGWEAGIDKDSVEYTKLDRVRYLAGAGLSSLVMWPEIMTVNFFDDAPRIEVPVYFFTGRHDYNTPFELAEQYYLVLDAPRGKRMIWFDESGHSPCYEETDKFVDMLVNVVLKETYPGE